MGIYNERLIGCYMVYRGQDGCGLLPGKVAPFVASMSMFSIYFFGGFVLFILFKAFLGLFNGFV